MTRTHPAPEGPQAAPPDHDRDRRRHRRRSVRGVRRGDQRDRTGRLPQLPRHRRADHPGDADARRDGHRQPLDRLVRRLLAQGAGRLGGLLGRLALLVLLGDRRRLRGRGRREDPHLLVRRAALVAVAGPDGADDRDEPVLGRAPTASSSTGSPASRSSRSSPSSSSAPSSSSGCGPTRASTSAT